MLTFEMRFDTSLVVINYGEEELHSPIPTAVLTASSAEELREWMKYLCAEDLRQCNYCDYGPQRASKYDTCAECRAIDWTGISRRVLRLKLHPGGADPECAVCDQKYGNTCALCGGGGGGIDPALGCGNCGGTGRCPCVRDPFTAEDALHTLGKMAFPEQLLSTARPIETVLRKLTIGALDIECGQPGCEGGRVYVKTHNPHLIGGGHKEYRDCPICGALRAGGEGGGE